MSSPPPSTATVTPVAAIPAATVVPTASAPDPPSAASDLTTPAVSTPLPAVTAAPPLVDSTAAPAPAPTIPAGSPTLPPPNPPAVTTIVNGSTPNVPVSPAPAPSAPGSFLSPKVASPTSPSLSGGWAPPPGAMPSMRAPAPKQARSTLGLKKLVATGQSWFSNTCADLAPTNIQIAANVTSNPNVLTVAALAKAALLWDSQSTISYGYIPGGSSPAQQTKIDGIISTFVTSYVGLTLTKLTMTSDPTSPVPTIRISCSSGFGSWSYVGQSCSQVSATSATMNLDAISDTSPATMAETGIVLHQLLHALGMTHELPSSIKLDPTAANTFYSYSQNWAADMVTADILDVYNTGDVSNYSQVDQSSLMMYYMPTQLNQAGQNVPINAGPSTQDVSWLRVNYPGPNAAAVLSLDLDALGVTGDTKTSMLTAPLATVRTQLATWQATQLIQSAVADGTLPPGQGSVPGNENSPDATSPTLKQPARSGRAAAALDLDPPPMPQPDIAAGTGNFLTAIVRSFRQVFSPGGGQIFTLQFPGRFLQMSEYAWDTNAAGIYGSLVKPVAVNEAEFRLVDQLYDVADVVASSNGVSLSQVYEQLLNNLVPISINTGLPKLQDEIRKWLLTDVKATPWIQRLVESQHSDGTAAAPSIVSDVGTINRLELSNTLMQDYLNSKQNWETERDQMMEDALRAADSADALATLSRKLAHTTATRKAQLAAKYTDAIVRGYTHNVREYISYLDVKTTAEALQDAKDTLREAAMSSLDGSLTVYPVQLSPIDWFEGLSTSFTPEDLTTNADSIVQQINTKSQQLDVLNQQLIALQFGEKGDVATLEEQVTQAQAAVDTQLTNLAMTYTNNVIAMAQTCLDSKGELDVDQLVDVGTNLGLAQDVITQLSTDMQKTADAQQALTSASRAYAKALAAFALAQATDSKQQQEQIRQQITSLTSEIDVLTARYQSLNAVGARPLPPPAEPTDTLDSVALMPPTSNNAGGSRWQDIVMHQIVQSDYSKQEDRAFGSTTSMTCNLWAISGSGEVTTSGAAAASVTTKMRNEVWVGFRATLVTIDRGGWFQPQFFKQSTGYYHISKNTFWSRWPSGIATMAALKEAGDPAFQVINQGLLPAFPQAMIICKDITIKISNDNTSVATSSVNMQSMAAASGGVLCFSISSSDSSSSSENTYSFKQCTDGCVIRIPGPQILGYIMQLTENDATRDLPGNLANLFVPPADIYDEVPDQRGTKPPARALRDAGPVVAQGPLFEHIDEILSKTALPARTVLDIRSAVQKELDVMSEDVATRIREG